MSSNPIFARCCQCDGELPPAAPRGLCPKCLMAAVAAPTEPAAAHREKTPGLETVAAAFPHLEILEWIGQGGMGAVYKARQPKLNRFVALKILPESLSTDPAFAERFLREGQMLARLNHPNIVTVHDFGQAGSFFYLLMEFVDGVNLRQAMRAGRFTPGQALAIVPRICEALQFAHDEGVLHRDIKPENILLDTRGRVKLVDFGIAKLVGTAEVPGLESPELGGTLTQSGAALGTPSYMAPEQRTHPSAVDHRADIYSLGVVFYELLTGELPTENFPPPSARSQVPTDIDAIVLRALEQERARRQQSAAELKTEVETLISNAVSNLARANANANSPEPPVMEPERPPSTPTPTETAGPVPVRTRGTLHSRLRRIGVAVAIAVAIAVPVRVFLFSTRPSGKPALPTLVSRTNATKVIVLDRGWVQTNANAVSLMSQSVLSSTETILIVTRQPDGRMVRTPSGLSIGRTGGSSAESSTASFTWHFPESFGLEEQVAAWDRMRATHLYHPLKLEAGEPLELFSVTNHVGGVLAGFLEYSAMSEKEIRASQSNQPIRATVRLKPKLAAYGMMMLEYSYVAPPGHRVVGGCGGPAAGDGQATTHLQRDAFCTWFLHGQFESEQARQASQQLVQRSLAGSFELRLGQPELMFSVTNAAGEPFVGYLELVGPTGPASDYTAWPTSRQPGVEASPAGLIPPAPPLPTQESMRQVAERITKGDAQAFEELQALTESLYRNLNYRQEPDRVLTNLHLMTAAYEVMGQKIAEGNTHAFDAVQRSLASPHMKSFAPRALGIAAAAGHQPSLDLLLNYQESKILLSSAVSALKAPAAKNNPAAVEFLIGVMEDDSSKALWHMASLGLKAAADAGNERAATVVKDYEARIRKK